MSTTEERKIALEIASRLGCPYWDFEKNAERILRFIQWGKFTNEKSKKPDA
jgi:hypothetical protein